MMEEMMMDDYGNALPQDIDLLDADFAPPSFAFELSEKEGSLDEEDILIIEEEVDEFLIDDDSEEKSNNVEDSLTITERSEDDPSSSLDHSSNTNSGGGGGGVGLFKFNLGEAWQGSTSALTKNLNNSLSTATTLFSSSSIHSNTSSHNNNNNSSGNNTSNGIDRYQRSQSLPPGASAALDEFRHQYQQKGSLSPSRKANRRATTAAIPSTVNCGKFEERVERLRYSTDDIFELVDDPVQFDELRFALRSMGVVTNNTLRLKLHWYVRNSKKDKLRLQKQQQSANGERPQLHDPMSTMAGEEAGNNNDNNNEADSAVAEKTLEISPRSVRGVISSAASALRLQK